MIPSFSHQLDITPAIAWSISPGNFSSFVSDYASNGVQIVGYTEYWETAQNSYHTDISNVVSDPGVSLSFTVANMGGKSRLLVNAPWANVVRDSSGGSVPYEASGSGIVIEVGDGNYTVAAAPQAAFSADRTAVVVGQTFSFTNTSSGGVIPLTYQWDFNNDGIGESTAQNPSYVYTSAGKYTVILKVTDAAANTDTETKAKYITVTTSPPTNNPPNTPVNSSPGNETTGVSLTPTLQSSAFSDPDIADTHAASQWQVTTTAGNYVSPVFDSGADESNLTSVTTSSLGCFTTYYWHIRHQDSRGDWSDYSAETFFTTITLPPSVTTSPATALTNKSATLNGNLTSPGTASSVNVSFEWGTSTSYGSETSVQSISATGIFAADLTGLSANTVYHFRAKTVGDGSAVYGSDMTFTTTSLADTTGPVISSSQHTVASSGVTITWTTDEPTTCQVEYGLTAQYGLSATVDTGLANSHRVELTGLEERRTYHYRVIAMDGSNNQAVSADNSFTTQTRPGEKPTWAWVLIGLVAAVGLGGVVSSQKADLYQGALLRRLDEAVGRVYLLERERNEAEAKLRSMERNLNDLSNLLSLAGSKADDILKGGPAPDASKGHRTPTAQVTRALLASEGLEKPAASSAARNEGLQRRFPHAFTLD